MGTQERSVEPKEPGQDISVHRDRKDKKRVVWSGTLSPSTAEAWLPY